MKAIWCLLHLLMIDVTDVKDFEIKDLNSYCSFIVLTPLFLTKGMGSMFLLQKSLMRESVKFSKYWKQFGVYLCSSFLVCCKFHHIYKILRQKLVKLYGSLNLTCIALNMRFAQSSDFNFPLQSSQLPDLQNMNQFVYVPW